MHQFNWRFQGLDPTLQAERYTRLARAALQHYSLGAVSPVFIRHNGGVTYRLDGEDGRPRYLLKIAQPVGESGGVPPQRLRRVLAWLAALAAEGRICVQEPIATDDGKLLAAVGFDDLAEPFYCSVQRWIDGVHVRTAFTPGQAYAVGAMIAHLHDHSAGWTPREPGEGIEQDETWLEHRCALLGRVVTLGLLSAKEWQVVAAAAERIAQTMQALGREPERWGDIHGDLHQNNLLFHAEMVRPIDFGDFRLAHFPYDLGVVLYHLMYLDDVAVRRAVLDGYRSVRSLPGGDPLWAESFLCAAAVSNLSFQVTIPAQRASPHFARNVREFAASFCQRLVSGEAFTSV